MTAQVMIVDDDAAVSICIEKVLTAAGFTVVKSSSGMQCLDRLRAGFSGVILMDITMPKLDGWATIHMINAQGLNQGINIYVLTSEEELEGQSSGTQSLIHGCLAKPFDNKELIALARKAFQYLSRAAPLRSSV